MVARIIKGRSLSRSLNYNEQKLKEGHAELILAVNYAKDAELLNFRDKLHRLTHQARLNERVMANSVHLSLNFDPKEKLDREKLQAIALRYMEKIGFDKQPYLVYRHNDAGHPHIHILTTNIEADGKRIDMNNIGRNQSEKARKLIDEEFRLISPESNRLIQKHELKQENEFGLRPVNVQKVRYGKSETKRAIQNVVDHVMKNFKYTSLPEFNAVLKLYNVLADRGEKDSLMFKNKGLTYRVLNEKGNTIGIPIKASEFYNKPTLKNLELKFTQNESLRLQDAKRLRTYIDWSLQKVSSLQSLSDRLKKENILVMARQNADGRIYGMTFIDLKTKSVFNGSDLGRQYSSNALLERCHETKTLQLQKIIQEQDDKHQRPDPLNQGVQHYKLQNELNQGADLGKEHLKLLDELLRTELRYENSPWELRQKKRLRKRHKPKT